MQLSQRLEAVLELVPGGETAADIGTDHAHVPIELVRRGLYKRAVAADLRPGPLKTAAEHVREAGLEEAISLRLGDGLAPVAAGEADTVLISGMGGPLMQRILTEGEAQAKAAKTLILSPQSELPAFRTWLQTHGYRIAAERQLLDEGKYYTVFLVQPGTETPWTGPEREYGRYLLREASAVTENYIRRDRQLTEKVLEELPAGECRERRAELEAHRRLADEALQCLQAERSRRQPDGKTAAKERNKMKTVFLVGDSIRYGSKTSCGYGGIVAAKLADKARVLQPDDNCRFTTYTLRCTHDWFKDMAPDEVDIIHWNNGLWDMVRLDGDPEPLVSPEDYARNLQRIAAKFRHFFPAVRIVFAYTTPICEKNYENFAFQRTNAVIREYNRIARETLEPLGVTFDDLYSVAENWGEEAYVDGKTHFCDEMAEMLADAVIASLPLEE